MELQMWLLRTSGGTILEDRLNFEYAIETLENIINRLEQGNETLDGTVKLYNEGTKLIKICKKSLSEAENDIDNMKSDIQIDSEDGI